MRDDDIASLYLYLRSLPAVAKPNRANAMAFPLASVACSISGSGFIMMTAGCVVRRLYPQNKSGGVIP
jgi:hypothetical protein